MEEKKIIQDKSLPQISSQMLDDEDDEENHRPKSPSLNFATDDGDEQDEIYYKVKEDSLMLEDRSMGTNQSEKSGSTFSLPRNWQYKHNNDQRDVLSQGNDDSLGFINKYASPKSSSAADMLLRPFSKLGVGRGSSSGPDQSHESAEADRSRQMIDTRIMRHSNSQALLPCRPLVIASRFDALKARNAA